MPTYNFAAKSGYTFQDAGTQYPWARFVRDPEADTPTQAPKMVQGRTTDTAGRVVAWPGGNGLTPLSGEASTALVSDYGTTKNGITRSIVDADASMIQPSGIASRTFRFSTTDATVRDRLSALALLAATSDITLVSTT